MLFAFFRKSRTLRVSILTLFLSLTIAAFTFIIVFTYQRNSEAIFRSLGAVVGRVNGLIVEKFTDLALRGERSTQFTAQFFPELGPMTVDNEHLRAYLFALAKTNPDLSNVYFGLPDGSFIGVFNLHGSVQTTFVGNSSKPLPSQVAFVYRWVNEQAGTDTWYYLDENGKTVTVETLPSHFNAVQRPWYEGAAQTKALYWTGFYDFHPLKEKGISVAVPVFDSQNQLIAVVGSDLTFEQMADFLSKQLVGKTGKVYLVSEEGSLVIPETQDPLLPEVIQRHLADPKKSGFIFEKEGTEYIAYVSQVPVIFGRNWQIIVIAPLSEFFSQMIATQRDVIFVMLGILFLSSFIIAYFAKRISDPIVILAQEINKIRQLELNSETRVQSNIKEISLIDASIAAMRRAVRSFASYVPKEVVKDLFQKGKGIVLGGEKKEVTIFFSDIASFTSIAETHSIEVLLPLLTEYFDLMTSTIHYSHGTIDKFLGDGIMAFWGAPSDIPDHAVRACETALHCHAKVKEFNRKRKEKGEPEFRTRFGINSGTVIVGNIGTLDRMNYTVIGDAVNITARLQEVDKFYHTTIIISDNVYQEIKGTFLARPLDEVMVRGKQEKTKIYELVASLEEKKGIGATLEQKELCAAFTEAYTAYEQKDYPRARARFAALLQKFPGDFPSQIYLERMKEAEGR